MTTQDIIQEILAQNPQISVEQILEKLQAEKTRTGGLLGDETLLRLIAAKFGVKVQQNIVHNTGNLSTSRLFAGLYDVTVAGLLIAIFPARTFEGEKPGKFATLIVADNEGILRVVLWNDQAELVESGKLKAGQTVRLLHGYTRQDRYGKTELHLGVKSHIEIDPERKTGEYPSIEKFAIKISTLTETSGNVHLSGTVKDILGKKTFTRSDQTNGAVMRLTLTDNSGEIMVVAWDEKAIELEKTLKANMVLQLINARVKGGQNGGLEVHVDSNTYVNVQAAEMQLTTTSSTENPAVKVQSAVSTDPQNKKVTPSKSENVKLTDF